MDPSLALLYGWIIRTREELFAYTASLPPAIYTREHPDFAYGSIRNIQAHVANCYLSWIGRSGLELEPSQMAFEAPSVPDAGAMRARFAEVDRVVMRACREFGHPDEHFELVRPGRDRLQVTQRWLVLHPVTHEFHHKGQLLALGRVLGYPLVPGEDTDLVLP
ncbi:DinB family protein [Deinococcus sp.]|uniref:DinB family protein n=1 Tax=Deinococcus sp. TaxID=47478 RepID=UPI0025CD371E|nr:DinB family protein [Deinococcus sp.]